MIQVNNLQHPRLLRMSDGEIKGRGDGETEQLSLHSSTSDRRGL